MAQAIPPVSPEARIAILLPLQRPAPNRTMIAELHDLYSTDVDDLRTFVPPIADNFGLLVRAIIRPKGSAGEESFDMMLCTPRWMLDHHQPNEVLIGRHYLIVFEYNYERLRNFILSYCSKCTGDTWEEIAARLSRLAHWEFEDYRD